MADSVSYDGRDLEVLAEMPRYYDWIVGHFAGHLSGDTIEFGAGTGTISSRLRPHVSTLELVEPSSNLTEQLRRRFRDDPAVTVSGQTLEAKIESATPNAYQAVVAVNLLEHIEDDRAAVKAFFEMLTPGGKLCLFVPALPLLMSAVDREFGHLRRYTRGELVANLDGAGFVVREAFYMDMLGILPWLIVYKWGRSVQFNPHNIRAYDRIGIPFTRTIETLVSPPIGKNLVVIGEKPNP